MSALRRIGILADTGQQAATSIMRRLSDAVAAGDDSEHDPPFVVENTQVPSRALALIEGIGQSPRPVPAGAMRPRGQLGLARRSACLLHRQSG